MKKLIMALVLMPLMALADTWTDPETGITWKYYIRDGKSSVVEGATPAVGAMTIPSKLGGCPVTSIGNNAFEGCTGLTSVTLPLNVEEITFCAFYNCSGLKEVTIPPSVTYMGSGAFAGCCGLTSVTIPSNMTTMYSAFASCRGLKSIVIFSDDIEFLDQPFVDCGGLSTIYVPKGKADGIRNMLASPDSG